MRFIVWIIISGLLAYISVFYESKPLCALTMLVAVLPVISLIIALLRRYIMKIKLSARNMTVNYGEGIKARIILYGLPLLTQPLFDCNIHIKNLLTGHESDKSVPIKRGFFELSSVTETEVISEECGMVEISLGKSRMKDSLGIFYFTLFKKTKPVTAVITVLPKISEIPVKISSSTANYFSNTEVYSTEKSGDDPSEVFDVREYRAGDSLRSIHWKQTAKSGHMTVKEMSFPIESSAAIVYNCTDNNSDALNFITSLSLSLLAEDCSHRIYYKIDGDSTSKLITNEDDLSAILPTLLSKIPEEADFQIKESFICEVLTGGRVYVNGDPVCDVFDKYMPIIEVKEADY